jgi:hypothetical protein
MGGLVVKTEDAQPLTVKNIFQQTVYLDQIMEQNKL